MASAASAIFKSGDPKLPSNYRPIITSPILYKLFARMLSQRLEPLLVKEQAKDQAGFRRGFSTVDHLRVSSILQEAAWEWSRSTWFAALDFKKAFDR
eukprot:8932673-Pyramimonas_sp.AAC.1